MKIGQEYIGKTLDEAVALAKANGRRSRVKSIDGVSQPVTMEMNMSRLNFHLKNGIVVDVTMG